VSCSFNIPHDVGKVDDRGNMGYNMDMIFISANLVGMAISVVQDAGNISEKLALVMDIEKTCIVFTAKNYLVENLGIS